MPAVNDVKAARKSPGSCGKCGKKIEKGDSYIWWKFRYGGKRIRCTPCPRPRRSELTNSDKLSRCYAAEEDVEDAMAAFMKDYDLENLKSEIESAIEEAREVAQEYRDSAEAIESGMNNRMPACDELEEKADSIESKADELESAIGNCEEFDEDSVEVQKGEDKKEAIESGREAWAQEVQSQIENCVDLSPD